MGRQPFPRPGEKLADEIPPELRRRPRGAISIFGGVGYAPGHPSRWAGAQGSGTTRLTVEDDWIVLTPLWVWQKLNRLPSVRIPLDAVDHASRIAFGLKFAVPGDPALDGTRFKAWLGESQKLEPLIELLEGRGISVEPMSSASERFRGLMRDHAVAARPGWIWRDRGRLSFVESAAGSAVALAVLYALGFFSQLAFAIPALTIVVALNVWGWFAGTRRRRESVSKPED